MTRAGAAARSLALVATLLCACGRDPLGAPCKTPQECGSGYDCYRNVCVHVCTSDAECRAGQVCTRYRCLAPSPDASTSAAPAATPTPPLPDATAAELRALRRELELVRRDQQRLTELLEKMVEGSAATKAAPPRSRSKKETSAEGR